MIVNDYFSGTGSFSEAFVDRGHTVRRFDHDERFSNVPRTEIRSVLDLEPEPVDVVLAGPPCQYYSVAGHFKHFAQTPAGIAVPRDPFGEMAEKLTRRAVLLGSKARIFLMENPVGLMRKAVSTLGLSRMTVWYCQYGDERAKPTDLFGAYLKHFEPKTCHNGASDHARARRGWGTGTQGRPWSVDRARVPYGLSLALCIACERELGV